MSIDLIEMGIVDDQVRVRTREEVEYLVRKVLLNREYSHVDKIEDLKTVLKRKYKYANEQLITCAEAILANILQYANQLPGVENRYGIIRGSEPKSQAIESTIGPHMGRLFELQTRAMRKSVPHMAKHFKPQSWKRSVDSFERNSDIDIMIQLAPPYNGLNEIREKLGFVNEVAPGLYRFIGTQFESCSILWRQPTVSVDSIKHIYIEIYSSYGQVITYDIGLIPDDPSFFTEKIREGLPASKNDLFVTADLIQSPGNNQTDHELTILYYKESAAIMSQIDRPFVASPDNATTIAEFVRQSYMRMLFPLQYDKPGYLYEMLACEGIENPIEQAMYFIFAVQEEIILREELTWDEQAECLVVGNQMPLDKKADIIDKLVTKFLRGFPPKIIEILLANPYKPLSRELQERIMLLASPFLEMQNRAKNYHQQEGIIDVRESDILKDSLRMVTADPFSGLRILFHTGIAEFSGLGQLIRRCGGIENVLTHFTIILNDGQKIQLTPEGYHQLVLRDAITKVENTGPAIAARAIQDIVHETMPQATFGPIALYAWDLFTVDPVRMIN